MGYNEKNISKMLNICVETIQKFLYSNSITKKKIQNRKNKPFMVKVKRININDNSDIMIFESIREAYKSINKRVSSHIQEVCNKKRKQAYGYI